MLPTRNTFRLALMGLVLFCLATPAVADVEKGQKALEAERYEDAAKHFAKTLKTSPKDAAAAIGLGEAVRKGNLGAAWLRDASDALETARDDAPKHVGMAVALGEIYLARAAQAQRTDPKEAEFFYTDAESVFEEAVSEDPKHTAAAVGLARTRYWRGNAAGAVAAVDAFLAQKPAAEETAAAHFWRGEALFYDAETSYGQTRELSEDIKAKFTKAYGAYAAATAADPSNYQAWIKQAYAAQWTWNREGAKDAYMNALAADGTQSAPISGLRKLLSNEEGAWSALLPTLVERFPKNEHVLLHAAFEHIQAKDYAKAKPLLERYVNCAKDASAGWYYRADIALKEGDEAKGRAWLTKALELRPDYEEAAAAYDALLHGNRSPGQIAQGASYADIQALIAQYDKLFKLAPQNVWVRNSLGFILRDVYVAKGGSAKWVPVLKRSADAYESATAIIGQWDPGMERSLSYQRRYDYAGTISDTALMFQFHAPIQDLEKAVRYYESALEWSDYGYFDTWNNLRQIYQTQEKWQELHDLAMICADNLVHRDGKPHAPGRAAAAGVAKKLRDEGKATE